MGIRLKQTTNKLALSKLLNDMVKENNLKLELINYGIAFRVEDKIYMNKNLLNYEEYCLSIFDHEKRHSGQFKTKDFIMDVTEGSLITNLNFCIRHPYAFSHFFPFNIINKTLLIDINLLIIYMIFGIVLLVV